jgi:CubicO group peptidase (beta-lactamase class C family)
MFPDSKFLKIRKMLEQGVASKVFAAAQAAWDIGGRRAELCVGDTLPGPVRSSTQFDIASITKVFAASACLRLADRGVFSLNTAIGDLVPRSVICDATIAELLSHEAGFAAWVPLHEKVPLRERGTESARRTLIHAALTTPPEGMPGAQCLYSDLGFIVLAHILETFTKQRLDILIQEEVLLPMNLKNTCFRPFDPAVACGIADIAPTSFPDQSGEVTVGVVHDDNARIMGGISAHAGLFAPASDVAAFGRHWLSALTDGRWLSVSSARTAVHRRPLGRGLGWDFKSEGFSSAGTKMSNRTFGHLGFTGCSLWVDPERDLSVALLSNRVRYGNDNNRIRDFRPLFHDMLVGILDNQID